jgi:hypothetical protein
MTSITRQKKWWQARILKNWVLPNPNLLPFLVRFVRIRFESESQILKKDSRFDEQRFAIKIWYFTKYKWQETFKTAKFHL